MDDLPEKLHGYVLVACGTGDYDAPQMTIEEIRKLDEHERGYFYIVQAPELKTVVSAAIDHVGEWFSSKIEELATNLSSSEDDTETQHWRTTLEGTLQELPYRLAQIALMEAGDQMNNIVARNDWVRIDYYHQGQLCETTPAEEHASFARLLERRQMWMQEADIAEQLEQGKSDDIGDPDGR